MPHHQTITTMDPKLIMHELDELDRVVHRLKTRLAAPLPKMTVHAQNVWRATHGVMGRERGKTLVKHLTQSRRKDGQRLAALVKLAKLRT